MKQRINHSIPVHSLVKISMVVLILAAVLFPALQPALAATCTEYHTVKRGETLYEIGLQYGVSWKVLAEINDLEDPGVIYTGQKLCVSTSSSPANPPSSGTIPTFNILSVVKDQSVTIQTSNFPANDTFDVLMGEFGTQAKNGIKVDRISSGQGGSFKATFTIPAALYGYKRIAIRLQSSTGSGYFAYNWFTNNTSGSSGGEKPPASPGYSGIPTFKIASVVRDTSVTIKTSNFPANDTFAVSMGAMGTRGVNGIKVDQITSGSGGELTLTFNIPASLQGSRQIAIRLESSGSGYYAYNWFYNNTTR